MNIKQTYQHKASWLSPLFLKRNIPLVVALGFVAVLTVVFSISQEIEPAKELVEVSTGEITPIAKGLQTYTIITDNPQNPQIIRVDLDPLDVKINNTQTITVWVEDTDNSPITDENTVFATIYTDNGSTEVSFALKRADGPDLVTTWEGSWTAEGTYDYIYSAVIVATNAQGESSVHLSFR